MSACSSTTNCASSCGGSGSVTTKLSIMMFLQFFTWGAWFATLGACLGSKDVGLGSIIGNAYGSQPIAAILAPLFLGIIADRFFASERVMGVLHIVGGAILLMVPAKIAALQGMTPEQQAVAAKGIVNLFNLHMLCYMPTIALSNSVAFANITDRNKFPMIRVLGTIGWIAAGLLLAAMNASDKPLIFTVAGIAGIVLGVYCFFLPHTPAPAKGKKLELGSLLMVDAFKLLAKPSFAVFILCSTLVCIPLSYYYAFTSAYLPKVGFEAGKVGFYMSFGQMSEIFFMLLIPFFFRKLGVKMMLAIGMATWVLRYALFAMGAPDSVTWMILLGIIVHGICYDFFFVTGYMFTDKIAPAEVRNQAQSLVVFFTLGIGMFFGFGMAGKKFGDVFGAGAPPPPPEGIIENIQAFLGKGVTAFSNLMDVCFGSFIAKCDGDWVKFWAMPACLAAAILVIFLLAFWYKDEPETTEQAKNDVNKDPEVLH